MAGFDRVLTGFGHVLTISGRRSRGRKVKIGKMDKLEVRSWKLEVRRRREEILDTDGH